ncbi:MAG: DedA family protein [Gammaproteobacteria bacterium]|nr:DedA family protein [Gammaproteobacteria bacterium]NNF59812.1 DedA family protein [Gammaproteobacteria bacterium]NNM21314.1 DedA family protein [Gammaproteobacteria bacterium]
MIFTALYDRALRWSQHRHAPWYLGTLSFAESSFFPVPPDVMLAPMVLAQPRRGPSLALLTTVTSVLGGVAGWLIGYFGFEAASGLLQQAGYMDDYARVSEWFGRWGFWAVLLAGFSPVPYKIFTIAAGSLAMPLPLFVLASTFGRGARFFLVALMIMAGGERAAQSLRRHVEVLGWAIVAIGIVVYLWVR